MTSVPGKGTTRTSEAFRIRVEAANLAKARFHPLQVNNGEETLYRTSANTPSYSANFTKGLPHDITTGILANPLDYPHFVQAALSGNPQDVARVPLGPAVDSSGKPIWQSTMAKAKAAGLRGWDSVDAGQTYDLQGPDSHALTIPPAPTFDSYELQFEMTELYLMALARDIPFSEWGTSATISKFINILNALPWIANPPPINISPAALARRRPMQAPQTVFRGIGQGVTSGLYVSQFLIRGTKMLGSSDVSDNLKGFISYGALRIDQRVRVAKAGLDFMTTWESFIDVQNGADLRGLDKLEDYRFITTPRDLATWVHYDALYQAYLNALFILLADGIPFDVGLPFRDPAQVTHQSGFATFGGPHILSLLTEVATRALKAVWYQKYNNHRRVRPEAVGGLIHRNVKSGGSEFPEIAGVVKAMTDVLPLVKDSNKAQNQNPDRSSDPSAKEDSYLLPLPFPEGSPLHPAYGSGHATVAGACVTVLKAWFDADAKLSHLYNVSASGTELVEVTPKQVGLTSYPSVAEELNKIAANIAVARSWAGVHYWTDYWESILLGEQVAIGILEEQKLIYGETFTMTLPKFDGTTTII